MAAVVPVVKRVVSRTPEAVQRARKEFADLEAWLSSGATLQKPLHEVEREQEHRGREVQRLMLQAHIEQRGNGDVGPALRVIEGKEEKFYRQRRVRKRRLKTIFGLIEIVRIRYGQRRGKSIYPLDEDLQLPARSFSYELQKRMVKAAVQGPFHEVKELIKEISGVSVPKRSVEAVIEDAAEDFDAFYAARTPEPSSRAACILVAAVDCKGIPMVKKQRAQHVVRPGRGKKANKKKMATVATVFTRKPWVRSPEAVVESLFASGPRPLADGEVRPRPEHKRVWASLVKGKAAVIAEVAEEIRCRDPRRKKTHVAVTDGERALQILIKKKLKIILILDLLHVLEKLWKAAYVFHREGSPEAEQWVRIRTLRILQGHVSQVVKGLRQSATKLKLRGAKHKTVRDVAGYLYRNRTRMRYDHYLASGLPIASGPVEGACKHLIKDRMERSGMRWTQKMAEAMVKLRAIYLSGDIDHYWRFHIEKDQLRLHPPRRWTVVTK
jgi:hypothetical protein